MVDKEMLRIEKLVEERQDYENAFFSCDAMLAVEELEYTVFQFEKYCEMFAEPFNPFALDDEFEKQRDKVLIEEREAYEIEYFRDLTPEKDFLDYAIESYEEPLPEAFYEMFDDYEDMFEDFMECDSFIEEPIFIKKPSCCWCDRDYMPHDDVYDTSDCYYYPDGNLLGIYPL